MNQQPPSLIIGDLESQPGLTLEKVNSDADLRQLVADEKFMNELVEIEIAASTNDNDPPLVPLNVNGINQPVWRGYPVKIKRMFVEVLARMKETRYSQLAPNYMNPEISNELRPRTGLSYPFQVLHDPNPKGRHWLQRIMAEVA